MSVLVGLQVQAGPSGRVPPDDAGRDSSNDRTSCDDHLPLLFVPEVAESVKHWQHAVLGEERGCQRSRD